MEKRAILAAVLMAALLMLYQVFFLPPAEPPRPPAPKEAPPAGQPAAPPAREGTPAVSPAAPRAQTARVPEPPAPPQRTARVESPLYDAVVSSEGGRLLAWTLKYRGAKPLVVLGEVGPGGLMVSTDGGPATVLPMALSTDSLRLGADHPTGDLVLTGQRDGVRVQETLRFQADRYAIDASVRTENVSGAPRTVSVTLPWTLSDPWKEPEKFTGQRPTEVVWSIDGRVDRPPHLGAVGNQAIDGQWIGLDSVWYLSALIPQAPGFKLVTSTEGKVGDTAKAAATDRGRVTIGVRATPTLAPGQSWEGTVALYSGPKEYGRLKAYGLEGTINFGGFPVPRKYGGLPMEWLGVPILLLLKWVYRYVGNYGVAIILLTVLSKVLFYPLTVKSLRSMRAMQALQPQVNSLRSKLKDDPQRLQRETMELYRKYKVNPMGGCLPMVAQIPIFYALYLALSVSVELQNAPFICFGRFFGVDLWVCDLASHDPTYVLPILMGISMFVQQKMSPTMGDPRQARMMLVMPFVFTFMFLNLPSGLVLYWFVSNVLQIVQQYYMDRSKRHEGARETKHVSRA